MRSFLRVVHYSFQNMYRNFSLSLMTVLVLVLMLMSINAMVFVRVITEKATSTIKDQIDVSVYFNHEATDDKVTEVTQFVLGFPEVTSHTFMTSDDALNQFKETYASNEKIMRALDELGDNPLGPVLIVKTREPSDYKKIIAALNVPEYKHIIEARTFEDTELAIEKIDLVTKRVESMSLGLSVFFGVIAFIIIFNTIRVAIYTQRIEISIKKLVGATNWFVRGPYIISSIWYSLVSTIITLFLVFFAANAIEPQLAGIFQQSDFLTSFLNSSIMFLFLSQLGIVLLLTTISSVFAMSRYLRV